MNETIQERISRALAQVHNPRTGMDVVAAEMVRDIATTPEGRVRLTVLLAPSDDATIVREVRQAIERIPGIVDVRVDVKDPSELRPVAAPPARPAPSAGA